MLIGTTKNLGRGKARNRLAQPPQTLRPDFIGAQGDPGDGPFGVETTQGR